METPDAFTFETLKGHVLYPATIKFQAVGSGSVVRFTIDVRANFADNWSRLKYYAGGNDLEDNIRENLPDNVERYSR